MVATVAPNLTGPSPEPASMANAGPFGTIKLLAGLTGGSVTEGLDPADADGTGGELSGGDLDLHADAPKNEASNANASRPT